MNQQQGLIDRSTHHKYVGLDHLRALAIVLVILFHYQIFEHPKWIEKAGKFGWTGVDLFFVLSGYLISAQLFATLSKGRKISFPEFFIKRFFRIIPAYLAILAIYFFVPGFHEREALSPWWRFLTFTQNFCLNLRVHGTFSHSWSLCIEEQFYLLLPIILIAIAYFKLLKYGYIVLILLVLAGFFARIYCWYFVLSPFKGTENYWVAWNEFIYYPTYNRLDGLLTGVTLAALFQFRPAVKAWIVTNGNYLLSAGLVGLACSYFVCLDEHSFTASVFGFPLVSLSYGLIVAAAISPVTYLYKNQSSLTTNLATLSYALYLSHKGVIHVSQQLMMKWGLDGQGNLMFLLCISIAVGAAWLINRIIEKPFLRLREKILQDREIFLGR